MNYIIFVSILIVGSILSYSFGIDAGSTTCMAGGLTTLMGELLSQLGEKNK